jgi:Raf kinase inhibitor-like YbhB/YbcL family protein
MRLIGKALIMLVFVICVLGCTGMAENGGVDMKIKSSDLKDTVPVEFTCDGVGISPALNWSDIPNCTKSLALSVTDPDAPSGTWVHWLVYNIPANKTSIARGEVPGTEVINDFRYKKYGGPCPPSGTHRYYFTIYALNIENLGNITNKTDFFNKISQHTIAKAEIMSRYSRQI